MRGHCHAQRYSGCTPPCAIRFYRLYSAGTADRIYPDVPLRIGHQRHVDRIYHRSVGCRRAFPYPFPFAIQENSEQLIFNIDIALSDRSMPCGVCRQSDKTLTDFFRCDKSRLYTILPNLSDGARFVSTQCRRNLNENIRISHAVAVLLPSFCRVFVVIGSTEIYR